jgi:hypothetical protein
VICNRWFVNMAPSNKLSHLQRPASLATSQQISQGDNLKLACLNEKQPIKLVHCHYPAVDLQMTVPASKLAPTLSTDIPCQQTDYFTFTAVLFQSFSRCTQSNTTRQILIKINILITD